MSSWLPKSPRWPNPYQRYSQKAPLPDASPPAVPATSTSLRESLRCPAAGAGPGRPPCLR